jgi:hypothetical protein
MSRARAVLVDDVIRELRRHDRRAEEELVREGEPNRPQRLRRRLSRRTSTPPSP